MPKMIACTKCQASLGITEEMAGKMVRCPKCAEEFVVPWDAFGTAIAPPPAAPAPPLPRAGEREERVAEAPRRRRFEERDDHELDDDLDYGPVSRLSPAWRTVRTGINLMYIGLLIMVVTGLTIGGVFLAFVGLVGFQGLGPAGGGQAAAGLVMALMGLVCVGSVGLISGGITYLVGWIMGVAAPVPRLKAYLLTSLGCFVGNFVIGFMVGFAGVALGGGMGRQAPPDHPLLLGLNIVNNLVQIAMTVSLILFLRGVAEFFANEALVRGYAIFLVFAVCMHGVTSAFALALPIVAKQVAMHPEALFGQGPPVPAGEVNFYYAFISVALVGGVIYLFWSISLLRQVRNTITGALAGEMRGREY